MTYPDFCSAAFLHDQVKSILAFYEPVARDPQGGFYHCFEDDGTIYDSQTRHLVSSTRFVFNYAQAWRRGYGDHYRDWAAHGLQFVEKHRQRQGHYAWVIKPDGTATDATAMAYGQAFVMLAGASALRAGIEEGFATLEQGWQVLETHFWQHQYQAYADQRDPGLRQLDDYRGQNANMHACEAMLAAYEATASRHFLDRANLLARRFAIDLADCCGGQIWEHYDNAWQPDWEYNQDKPNDLFKPWGFQPGHQVEWAKLLLQLEQHSPQEWLLPRARMLFDCAWEKGWDREYAGLVYGYAPQGGFADTGKYFWVMAEAIAASWRLWQRSGESIYLARYKSLWKYAWDTLIDHQRGAWYRIRNRQGKPVENRKSPPGKVDYHTMGACWDVLDTGL